MQRHANCQSTPTEKTKIQKFSYLFRSAILRFRHISVSGEYFPINSDFSPNSVTSVETGIRHQQFSLACVVVSIRRRGLSTLLYVNCMCEVLMKWDYDKLKPSPITELLKGHLASPLLAKE